MVFCLGSGAFTEVGRGQAEVVLDDFTCAYLALTAGAALSRFGFFGNWM